MSALFDTREARPEKFPGLYKAHVATSAPDITDSVMVTIDGFHSQLRFGPCRWMPRGDSVTFPTRGDECVVMFDDTSTPVIVGWWPF